MFRPIQIRFQKESKGCQYLCDLLNRVNAYYRKETSPRPASGKTKV